MHYSRRIFSCAAPCVLIGALSANGAFAQSSSDCALDPSWFQPGQSIPNPSAGPDGLAFTGDFNSLCGFHQWSWNAFLYAMQPGEDGLLTFEGYPTQSQTIAGDWSEGDTSGARRLLLRVGKGDHSIDSVAQAGTTGILVAQNNRAVYYSQHINPVMYDQIIDLKWNTADGIANTPVDKGLFAIGSIEYKAAWAIIEDNLEVPGAYTRSAEIPKLVNNTVNGVTVIGVPADPSQTEYEEVTVALIGLHVVGWVRDHSEAVWASFSPAGIAPAFSTEETQKFVDTGDFPTSAISTSAGPFYPANAPGTDCNQTQTPVQRLDPSTQLMSLTTTACQVYAAGSLPGEDADNINTLAQINASAAALVPTGSAAAGYTEVGAIWSSISDNQTDPSVPVLNTQKLNTTLQNQLIGSTVLSNPVIETFTQTQLGQDNCFSCHNTTQFGFSASQNIPALKPSMLNVSHFLVQIYEMTAASN